MRCRVGQYLGEVKAERKKEIVNVRMSTYFEVLAALNRNVTDDNLCSYFLHLAKSLKHIFGALRMVLDHLDDLFEPARRQPFIAS